STVLISLPRATRTALAITELESVKNALESYSDYFNDPRNDDNTADDADNKKKKAEKKARAEKKVIAEHAVALGLLGDIWKIIYDTGYSPQASGFASSTILNLLSSPLPDEYPTVKFVGAPP